ncbi:6,7-dimethyl-8-ribityllumazine synthase [Methylacidiphilum caldifontis]|uniref:6,7-dimethyl-8-ribityllumazine synthase n=1 Tax=Methylacidiphilum caldifontis TaxID=2795386 RepID=A0A4Y8PHT4_9BACT|nr:6,7-dimethyl-8-ribityllumazine synthase [Methylacidiphilum caldifontis]QSR88513.1 6,7-dimethyl-8-ribityllumazine synthase [Methylacidiphilum caldifontis]TFE71339.1 6,7-dimethyl-8-ribityllumazine synthase [Methylacidiphilum caldifontis]
MEQKGPFRFGIIVSSYNKEYTSRMVESALSVLKGNTVDVVWVPGSFEIPLQAQRLAKKKIYDCILCFGIVWQGKTAHATEILRACTDALMRIGLENDVPVIHEILSVSNESQAKARTSGRLDRGAEGARTALQMASLNYNHDNGSKE